MCMVKVYILHGVKIQNVPAVVLTVYWLLWSLGLFHGGSCTVYLMLLRNFNSSFIPSQLLSSHSASHSLKIMLLHWSYESKCRVERSSLSSAYRVNFIRDLQSLSNLCL